MAKLIILFLGVISLSSAAIGEEFVREGWPGEGTPRLAAKNNELVLHKTPDSTSASRKLKYKAGWLIVWDQSKVITKKSVIWTVKKEIDKGSCGPLSPGDKVEFLQFEAEGSTLILRDQFRNVRVQISRLWIDDLVLFLNAKS